jgi:hypothetical protein
MKKSKTHKVDEAALEAAILKVIELEEKQASSRPKRSPEERAQVIKEFLKESLKERTEQMSDRPNCADTYALKKRTQQSKK